MRLALALLLLAAVPAWAGGPVPVAATSTDLQSLIESVGGELVRVVSLAPAVHEPHQVEVKPGQLAELRAAALLVRVGLDHEPWLARILQAVNDPRFAPGSPDVVDCSKGIPLLQAETARVRSERGVHVHGFGNTHYWLDPENARPITASILDALARLRPAERARFEANRERFLTDLESRLARWTRAMAPYRGTRAVVVHETWPYFARRFGLVITAALEPSPGVPPSPSHLASTIQHMKAGGVGLLIAGPESDAALVDRVAAQGGARAVVLVPSVGGDPAARDYLSLFDVNIRRLTEVLATAR
ncbi:MAG TPA: metal ABC transporter substrate-binding protein [Candidatus Methylomirabilis sp.]|nr:metal ABC transporter substrate-binding protein [Candidatus Methylomirabilis sp.]